jgi:hypothetical protein
VSKVIDRQIIKELVKIQKLMFSIEEKGVRNWVKFFHHDIICEYHQITLKIPDTPSTFLDSTFDKLKFSSILASVFSRNISKNLRWAF